MEEQLEKVFSMKNFDEVKSFIENEVGWNVKFGTTKKDYFGETVPEENTIYINEKYKEYKEYILIHEFCQMTFGKFGPMKVKDTFKTPDLSASHFCKINSFNIIERGK